MAKTAARASNNLTAEVRAKTGKGASRQARRDGKVPAVLYGHGTEPQHLTLPAREFAAAWRPLGPRNFTNRPASRPRLRSWVSTWLWSWLEVRR